MPTVVDNKTRLAESMHVVDAVAEADVRHDQDQEDNCHYGEHSIGASGVLVRGLDGHLWRVGTRSVDILHGQSVVVMMALDEDVPTGVEFGEGCARARPWETRSLVSSSFYALPSLSNRMHTSN